MRLCCSRSWLAAATPLAQEPPSPVAALEQIKTELDQIEATLNADTPTDTSAQMQAATEKLTELRGKIVALREKLRAGSTNSRPRVAELDARLKQLGPAPAKDAPPEEAAVAAEREEFSQNFATYDGALKQARLLSVKTDQLNERISERRRTIYARMIFQRSASVLDPYFWIDAVKAVPEETAEPSAMRCSRGATASRRPAWSRIAPAVLDAGAGVCRAVRGDTFWWVPHFDAQPARRLAAGARAARPARVLLAVRPHADCGRRLVMVLEAFGLLPFRIAEIAQGLIPAVFAATFGRGVARGLFAPDAPERRLIDMDDKAAQAFHDHLVWVDADLRLRHLRPACAQGACMRR